jgi:hypothetical protein
LVGNTFALGMNATPMMVDRLSDRAKSAQALVAHIPIGGATSAEAARSGHAHPGAEA